MGIPGAKTNVERQRQDDRNANPDEHSLTEMT